MNSAAVEFNGKTKYIRITDIDEASRKFVPSPLTSPDGEVEEKYKVKKGDLLFARTGASVGKCYLFHENDGNLAFAGFLIRFHVKEANPYFVFSYTFLEEYKSWVKLMSMRSGQPGINAEEYKSLEIPIPPLPEQEKIANYLSQLDEKIGQVSGELGAFRVWKRGLLQGLFV